MRRPQTIASENGDIEGILIEWGGVRLADDCAQKLLEIQITTNAEQKLLEWGSRMPRNTPI